MRRVSIRSRPAIRWDAYRPRWSAKPLTRGGFNQVDFALEAVEFGIGSVVITPGENPAHPILKGVVRRKPQNNPDEYERYHCATYTKMELDLTNIKPGFKNKKASSSNTSTRRRSPGRPTCRP